MFLGGVCAGAFLIFLCTLVSRPENAAIVLVLVSRGALVGLKLETARGGCVRHKSFIFTASIYEFNVFDYLDLFDGADDFGEVGKFDVGFGQRLY